MPQTSYIRWVPSPGNIKRIGKIHTFIYVATRGLLGRRMDGLDILLLTTVGARSGRRRRVPLPFFRLQGHTVLVASFGGSARNPAWYVNLEHQPEVTMQCGARRWTARARITQGEERARLWQSLVDEFPRYAVYQTRTERTIPLVVVEPSYCD